MTDTISALVLALSTMLSLSPGAAAQSQTPYGQEVRLRQRTARIQFGMAVTEAEAIAQSKASPVWWYEPQGIVKDLEVAGLRLRFEKERLSEITYTDSFDFSIPISPHLDRALNPPQLDASPLRRGMKLQAFLIFADAWKSMLRRSGYSEIKGPTYPKALTQRQFAGDYYPGGARWFYDMEICPEGDNKTVFWDVEFTREGVFKEMSVDDPKYRQTYVFFKK